MTKYQRAVQLWMILACGARERKLFTYGQLAAILGMGDGRAIARFLNPLKVYCSARQLPPLPVLVVNSKTGLPGKGISTLEDVAADREKVFRYDWFALEPPEAAGIADAQKNLPPA